MNHNKKSTVSHIELNIIIKGRTSYYPGICLLQHVHANINKVVETTVVKSHDTAVFVCLYCGDMRNILTTESELREREKKKINFANLPSSDRYSTWDGVIIHL